MPRRNAKSISASLKRSQGDGKFGKVKTTILSDVEIEELVEGDTNYRVVCDVECGCSDEDVLGINFAVNLDNLCHECDTAIAHEEKRWRSRAFNSNVKGAGTSRSTYFDKEKKRKLTEDAARNHSQPLQNFFAKADDYIDGEQDDDDDRNLFDILIDDETESEKTRSTNESRSSNMYSVKTGILAISKIDDKGKSLTGNSKDTIFEKSNAFINRLVAKAIHSYLILLNAGMCKMVASRQVAGHLFEQQKAMLAKKDTYRAQCVRQWSREFLLNGKLPKFKQGQHIKTATIITNEAVKVQFTTYLRGLEDFDRTPERFMNELNNELLKTIPNAPNKVCVETARNWMHYLGFHPSKLTKGYYTDDHNNADVIQYRDEFLKIMANYEKLMAVFYIDDNGINSVRYPDLENNQKRIVLITHDESTFYSNECKQIVWMENG